MLKMRVVQAHEGDCFFLIYGKPSEPRALLCDGGPKNTYEPFLRRTLETLDVRKLDAVILSHVDTDHAIGLLDFLADLRDRSAAGEKPLIAIDDVWMNSFDRTIDQNGRIEPRLADVASSLSAMSLASAETLAGVKEGNKLALLAAQLDIPTNRVIDGAQFVAGENDQLDFHGLSIRVVGPTRANLKALLADWEAWLEKQEERLAERRLRLAAMADKSIPNLSSLQLLVEAHGKSMLLTGDGRGDHLLQALEDANLLDEDGRIQVDLLKVPHHGSDRNVTRRFFEQIRARIYVVSANGKHGNPNLATLEWIVESCGNTKNPITIVATNRTSTTDKLQRAFPPEESGYELVLRADDEDFIDIELA